MKKTIVFITIFILALNALAQIEMFDESIQNIDYFKVVPYDSLLNIATKRNLIEGHYKYSYHHLKGQTIMYCGSSHSYVFKNSYDKGVYYRIDSIQPDNHVLLSNLTTGFITEERCITDDYNFNWVVLGYYEKMKSLYMNKEFVYIGFEGCFLTKADGLISLERDTVTTNISKGSVWTCIGVQVKPRKETERWLPTDTRSPVVLIVDNPIYGKHYCYLEDQRGKPYTSLDNSPLICGRFQLKSYYDNVKAITASKKAKRKAELTQKYGADNADVILEGKVRIGMTKAMCEEAWGYPDEINKMTGSWGTDEQWVYGNNYLYFENGELTTIQN